MADVALSPCAAQVRRDDPDRFLTALFAPTEAREDLFALYALNDELARASEAASEPLIGTMRLQWWRDALEAAFKGAPPRHPVAEAMAVAVGRAPWTLERLIALVDAREHDFAEAPPADLRTLESYVEATAAALAELAFERLGVTAPAVRQAGRHAAIAYGLAGVIRSIPAHTARRHVMLPANVMAQEGLAPAEIGRKHAAAALARVVASVAELAEAHVEAARLACPVAPRTAMPILLWASLARSDLGRLRRAAFDAFAPALARGTAMRRFAVTWRALTGRI